MSTTVNSSSGPFDGQFDPRIFAAIFVPAVFLLILILTMLVFLIYRQPSYYDHYVSDLTHDRDDRDQFHCKFEVISRTPISYA